MIHDRTAGRTFLCCMLLYVMLCRLLLADHCEAYAAATAAAAVGCSVSTAPTANAYNHACREPDTFYTLTTPPPLDGLPAE